MAIISASRRTDIPAFFTPWFMNRIRTGFFYRVNPFNSRQVRRVSLLPEDVDAIVFWSKNPRPLLDHLVELDQRGYSYYFQFTLTPYDQRFEPHLPPLEERIGLFRQLSSRLGTDRLIWRYDPVILSTITPPEFHVKQLERIAAALHGATGRLMFSFLTSYGKLKAGFRELERRDGVVIQENVDIERDEAVMELLRGIGSISRRYGMTASSCADGRDMAAYGIQRGSCVDGDLVATLTGRQQRFPRDRHQRAACRCVESIDMGSYDTCPFRCVYCYANRSGKRVEQNLARHDPRGAVMIGRLEDMAEAEGTQRGGGIQEMLF